MKKSIFLFFAAILCSVSAWGWDVTANYYVYFEKPSDWSKVSVLLGHDSYSQGFNMTKITNTNLYYWKTTSWGGVTEYYFINENGWGEEGNSPTNRKGWASKASSKFTKNFVKYHLFNSTSEISSHASDRKIAINRTQTIKVQLKDGSNWVDATVVPADLTASTYAMTDNSTAVSAASASLAKESTTVSATVDAAYSATVTLSCTNVLDGYMFEGWYDANGNKITSYTVSDAHTVYARFIQSAEETNAVTVTYMCGTTSVATEISETVGVESEKSFTAPTVTGYQFTNWTIGAGIDLKAGTATDATITVVTKSASSDYTLVANYEEVMETVYFINAGNWADVYIHLWNGTATGTEWPGTQLTATGTKIGEYDVYEYTAQQGAHANLLFHKKDNDSQKTTDLTWSEGVDKYYIHNYNGNTGWYTQAEAEAILVAPVVEETVYFVNNKNWTKVQVHAWKDAANNGWPGQALTATGEQVAGFDVYSYSVVPGSYDNIIFNNKEGDSGEQTETFKWTDGKYYYVDATKNYAGGTAEEVATALGSIVTYDYYLTGSLVGGWEPKQQGIEKDGELYKATFNALAAGTYEFKITAGDWEHQWNYNNLGAAYEEVSQGVDGEGNPNGNIKIFTEEARNITVIFDATAGKITFEGLTEKTINYVDIKLTITANSAPQIHYWGDGITGTDWNNLPSMTPTGNPNEYTFTIEDVDQEKGVNYLLKIGELQTADQSTKTDVVADFKDLLPLISIYGIVDWNAANAIHLTIADDYATATANVELAAETTYEFKVNIGAKWLGNVNTMTSGNCTGWTFAEKNGEEDMPNAGITTTIAGEYTFTWNVADNKLSVTYPTPLPATYTRDVTSGNFGTICLPYAGTISNATLFVLSYKDENYVYVDEIGTTLEAGKPYLFLPTSDEIIVNYTDYTYENAGQNGALYGTYVEMDNAALMGKYIISGNKYYLINNATGNSRLPENRAYFVLDDVSPSEPVLAPGARRIALGTNGQNTATGMENVDASAQPVKTIINGQLYILRGEKMYDAQGKLVK